MHSSAKSWDVVPYEGKNPFKKMRIRDQRRVRNVLRYLSRHDYVVILGPPASHKTWLLRDIEEALYDVGLSQPIFVDLWRVRSDDEKTFFTSIAKVMSQANHARFDAPQETITNAKAFQRYMEGCLHTQGHHITLLIDHLQALPDDLVHSLLQALRVHYQERQDDASPHLSVVVTGSMDLVSLSSEPTSPFNIAQSEIVKPLDKAQSLAVVKETFSAYGRSSSANAQEKILAWAKGDNYLISFLSTWSAEAVQGYRKPQITSRVVDQAVKRLLQADEIQSTISKAIHIIEEDPDTVLDVLDILEYGKLSKQKARQYPTRSGADRLQLSGAVENVDNYYQFKNQTYRHTLLQHFQPAQVGHVLRMNGRWREAIDYLAPKLSNGSVSETRSDLLEAIVQSIYAADDLNEAYEALVRGMKLGFGLSGIRVYRVDPVRFQLRQVYPQSSLPDEPVLIDLDELGRVEAQTYFYSNYSNYALRYVDNAERLVAALVPERRPIGIVTVEQYREVSPDKRDLPSELPDLMRFLKHAAGAIESVMLRAAYNRIGRAVLSVDDPRSTIEEVLRAASDALGCDSATLYLVDESETGLEIVTGVGRPWKDPDQPLPRIVLTDSHPAAVCLQSLVRTEHRTADMDATVTDYPGQKDHLQVFQPLQASGKKLGVLEVAFPQDQKTFLSEGDKRNLANFADQVAIAVNNIQLLRRTDEALEQRVKELEQLREISLTVSSTLDLEAVLRRVIDSVMQLFSVSDATIWEYHPDSQTLTILQSSIEDPDYCQLTLTSASVSGQAVKFGKARVVMNFQESAPPQIDNRVKRLGFRSMITMPMANRGRNLGAVSVYDKSSRDFDQAEQELLSAFAAQAAVAIDNAWQYQDLIETRRQLDTIREQETYDLANSLLHRIGRAGDVHFQLQKVRELVVANRDIDEPIAHVEQRFRSLMALHQPLKSLVELDQMVTERLDLRDVVYDALRNSTPSCYDVACQFQPPDAPMWVDGNAAFLCDAVQSVTENACEAIAGQGKLVLKIVPHPDIHSVVIEVRDDGPGIPEKIRNRVFEPGFSTRTVSGHERGKGLFTCRAIMRKHRGSITFESIEGEGTTFFITLPTIVEIH